MLTKPRQIRKIHAAWLAYLEACRQARLTQGIDPVTVEQWAWQRLQDELDRIGR